jgi:hypothetical protein
MKIDKTTQNAIFNTCLDDSEKIIKYFEEQEKHNRPYKLVTLIFTIVSAIGAVIAAITGIIAIL